MSMDEFRERYFTEASRPTRRQVYFWCAQGYLPVVRIGKRIYVETDRLTGGSPNVDRILRDRR